MRVRRRFIGAATENRKSSDTPEVALIKVHTRVVRLLSLTGIVLQVVLLVWITRLPKTSSSYSMMLVRPATNLCVFLLGFMTNTHAAFRLAFMLLLGQMVVFDTIAEVSFAMVSNCLQLEGIQCGDSALSLSLYELEVLKRRELASLFLNPWLALETAYLPAEIDFKDLLRQSAGPEEAQGPSTGSTATEPKAKATARAQRLGIIEHLEKRYGSGAVLNDGEDGNIGVSGGSFKRRDDDDLYDSEDSFIDDAELQQDIEEVHDQTKVQTKQPGFFVNAGDDIETLAKDEDDESDNAADESAKGKRGQKRSVDGSRALKSFLEEWPDAVSDWQPEDDIVRGLEVLRTAVRNLEEAAPLPKVFPRTLDEPLRAVDTLVVDSHPNKWRVNGYFATLMTFLPYTKQYLKDSELGANLHALLDLQYEWIAKENNYRQMLKTEDKKHMEESDYKVLNVRQERNRIFNRVRTTVGSFLLCLGSQSLSLCSLQVMGLFAAGLIDIQALRAMNNAAKAKAPKKGSQPKASAKGATGAARQKAPKAAPGTVKRAIKPFKSRMMDDPPPFADEDFDEVE
ncbi:hypothetical protein BBJ28_00006390 [Nothophytophthora sp. Chile5]|nr:hypothetical protein BBJ28_00006390 [Nothophytophthora sp. Chile5]